MNVRRDECPPPAPLNTEHRTLNTLDRLCSRVRSGARLAVLGIGSTLRQDDAAGMLVAASLLRRLGKRRCRRMGVLVLLAETAPENLAGELRRHRPEVVLVVDAAELGAPAGTIRILSLVRTAARACTTHGLSLNLLKNYVQADAPARWHIVGIQPASCEFGQPPTPAVRRAAHTVAKALADVLVGCTG